MIGEFHPDDRVLLLDIPDAAIVRAIALQLGGGMLVGLGDDERVAQARRASLDLDNVMFIAAEPVEIPWQDGFFSVVIDPRGGWRDPARVDREVARVLAIGGRRLGPAATLSGG